MELEPGTEKEYNKFFKKCVNGFSPVLKPFLFYRGFKVGFSGKDS
jgi:hypothetical protein